MKQILSSALWERKEPEKQVAMNYLKKWLIAFEGELKKYQERNPNDCPWWYGERTTLGLFMNAILQEEKQKMNFLQEFDSARKKKETKGRGDLLLWDKNICILFEAKKYYSVYNIDGEYYGKNSEDEFWFVWNVMQQAENYKLDEYIGNLSINHNKIFLVAICFDALLYPSKQGEKFEGVFSQWKKCDWKKVNDIDFYQFYHYSRDYDFNCMFEKEGNIKRSYLGMAVYGKIEMHR